MTTITKALIESKDAPTSQTPQYTATNVKTIIDKFTGTNTTGAAITLSINLVPQGGSAGATNLIVDTKTVQPGQTYPFPEVIGHTLEDGDFISVIASATGLTIRSSGREIS